MEEELSGWSSDESVGEFDKRDEEPEVKLHQSEIKFVENGLDKPIDFYSQRVTILPSARTETKTLVEESVYEGLQKFLKSADWDNVRQPFLSNIQLQHQVHEDISKCNSVKLDHLSTQMTTMLTELRWQKRICALSIFLFGFVLVKCKQKH